MSLDSCKVWFSKMRLGEVITAVLLNIYTLWVVYIMLTGKKLQTFGKHYRTLKHL